ncbi:uncharacterized protein LOC18766043 [Prunus persica]|nr:uncharacterized protein LOC18766043 [Prunus persica]
MLTLPELALNFLQASIFEKEPKLNSVAKHLHLLDFVRNCMLRSCDQRDPKEFTWHLIPSVTELLQDGVKFECGKKDDMFNVTFENGVMKIPPITVLGESLFRNLVAYEQCDPNIISSNNPFSSYAFLVDNLINSSKDVNFLVEKKIMRCFMSLEEAASFARLNNNDCLTTFSYVDLFENVTKYHQDKWHTWGERLKRDYFGNPWSAVSLVAVVVILGLTFIQTLYSILSYKFK